MARKPLRTFAEMAEEFGLSTQQLAGMARHAKGDFPKARFTNHGISYDRSWYDPNEMRAWWKLHKSSVKPR
jgi:hypothetical protein